jgi:hypothetical protein
VSAEQDHLMLSAKREPVMFGAEQPTTPTAGQRGWPPATLGAKRELFLLSTLYVDFSGYPEGESETARS